VDGRLDGYRWIDSAWAQRGLLNQCDASKLPHCRGGDSPDHPFHGNTQTQELAVVPWQRIEL
jgi:hypothetical protein